MELIHIRRFWYFDVSKVSRVWNFASRTFSKQMLYIE